MGAAATGGTVTNGEEQLSTGRGCLADILDGRQV
jgi:hypothetical protein